MKMSSYSPILCKNCGFTTTFKHPGNDREGSEYSVTCEKCDNTQTWTVPKDTNEYHTFRIPCHDCGKSSSWRIGLKNDDKPVGEPVSFDNITYEVMELLKSALDALRGDNPALAMSILYELDDTQGNAPSVWGPVK